MIVECAWCGAHLGEKEPLLDLRPTSGICDECVDLLESGQTCAAPRLRSGSPQVRGVSLGAAMAFGPQAMRGLHESPALRIRRPPRH